MSEDTDIIKTKDSSGNPIKTDIGSEPRRIKRKKIALNVLMQMLCAILLFILINYISHGNYHRWDLSSTKKYSVSGDTEAYLKNQLDEKVTLTMAFLKSSKIRNQLKVLLEEYENISGGKIVFDEFDPVINKNKSLEISDRYKTTIDQSCLFIEVGGRIKKLIENDLLDDKGRTFIGEDSITSAMLAATESKPKTVYLIAGKGKLKEVNGRSADKEILSLSTRHFFNLKELTLGNITKIPEDADSLIIINPETDFSLSEVTVLTKYWEQQRGSMVLLLNPATKMPNFYPFLRSLGVRVDNNYRVLFSETTGIGGTQKVYSVQSKLLGGNPITSSDEGAITTFAGQTCPISVAENNEGLASKGIIAVPLLSADLKFWGDLDHTEPYPKRSETDMIPDPNPIYVAAMVEKGGSEDSAIKIESSRMVVIGNSTLLDPIPTRLNVELVMNSINWTLDREERLGINPTNVISFRIDMSPEKYKTLFYLIVCIFPAIAFCFGIAVWSARRN
jgi:hypothetical protein|tara:strand:- start:544 stop:2058 length:1515 start_codon:yes stop_codon:yes gene_type:complete